MPGFNIGQAGTYFQDFVKLLIFFFFFSQTHFQIREYYEFQNGSVESILAGSPFTFPVCLEQHNWVMWSVHQSLNFR